MPKVKQKRLLNLIENLEEDISEWPRSALEEEEKDSIEEGKDMKLTLEALNKVIRNEIHNLLEKNKTAKLKNLYEELYLEQDGLQADESDDADDEPGGAEDGLEEQAPPAPPPAAPMPAAPMPAAPMDPMPMGMAPMPMAPAPGMPPAPGMDPMPMGMAPMPPMAMGMPPAAPMAPGMPPAAPGMPPAAPIAEIYSRGYMFESVRLQKLAGILKEEKWMQKAGEEMEKKGTKGALHRQLGKKEDEKITKSELNSIKKRLQKKAEGDKKLSAEDRKLLRRVIFALNAMKPKD